MEFKKLSYSKLYEVKYGRQNPISAGLHKPKSLYQIFISYIFIIFKDNEYL